MRRFELSCAVLAGFLFCGVVASAESPLDALENDLNNVKQQHDEATSQVVANMLAQLSAASQSPDAAITLYQQAGGAMPQPSPVISQYASETPDEKETRLALDQENIANLASEVQIHCGLMRFAVLFVVQPDQKGLQDDWLAWLKAEAQVYPELKSLQGGRQNGARGNGGGGGGGGLRGPAGAAARMAARQAVQAQMRGGGGSDIREMTMKGSIIATYLNFQQWGDKEQGQWKVADLPKFYRINILDPLRASPAADTLAAWDVYIAMKSADQTDRDKWDEVDYPALQFERDSDDYEISHSMEKLTTLVTLIKANPTHPQIEDWLGRVHKMLQDYRAQKEGTAPPISTDGTPHTDTSTASTTPDPAKT